MHATADCSCDLARTAIGYVAITSRFLLAIFIQLTTTLSSRSLQLAHGLQYDVELEDGHIGIIGTMRIANDSHRESVSGVFYCCIS